MIKLFEYQYFSEIISVFALLISILSFLYARLATQYKIEISDTYKVKESGNPNLIFFTLTNVSVKALKIESIELFNFDKQMVKQLNYEPIQTYSKIPSPGGYYTTVPDAAPADWEYQKPFSNPTVLTPNEKVKFSYYLSSSDIPTSIKVEANKKIGFFNKEKLFLTNFPDSE